MTRQSSILAPLLVVLALLLPACGFHLREAVQLPAELGPVKVTGRDPGSPVVLALGQALGRAGVAIAPQGATDVATLRVVGERWDNLPISVNQFGRAQEYRLRYAVIFNLRRADGSEFVPQQAIEISRDYISLAVRSEGTDSEREIIAREMRRDMVTSIVRRIDAVARTPGPVPATIDETGTVAPPPADKVPAEPPPAEPVMLDPEPLPAEPPSS